MMKKRASSPNSEGKFNQNISFENITENDYKKIIEQVESLFMENAELKKEVEHQKEVIKGIEENVRDEYLHTSDWTKTALVNLVNFAAIELEPATLEFFPQKVVNFLASEDFGYPYVGFFKYNQVLKVWETLKELGTDAIDIKGIPTFLGNMVLEDESEIFNFFSVQEQSYMICVSTVGSDKKFSKHDFSFISMFVTLMSSFFNMKTLAEEVEKRMVETAALRNFEKLLANLKNNNLGLEDLFSEMAIDLSIDSFLFAAKVPLKDDLKIIVSNGIKARNFDNFLKIICEDESYFQEEWIVLPVFDEQMTVYGIPAFKLSSNNPSLRSIQEKVLEWIIPQLSTVLSQKKFHKESITDELTGAYNRRYMLKMLEERFKKAVLGEDCPISVVMLDIDHFKPVNDTYGHQAGDKILKEVTESIIKAVREIDVVGRYGGEEFIIILGVGKRGAQNVCERIRKSIEERMFEWNGKEIWITVSLGCATYTDTIGTWDEMVSIADMCLYNAKGTGRNKVVVY